MTEIVVSHITRMTYPRICIAGISEESRAHIRPVTAKTDLLTRSLLAGEGGPLQLGSRIDLGETKPLPNPPENEDHWCETANFRARGALEDEKYLELVESIAVDNLTVAFGSELRSHGRSYAVDPGEGKHSLACVRASADERLVLSYGRPRWRDREGALVGVTDLRFFEPDQKTPRIELVAEINQRLEKGVPPI